MSKSDFIGNEFDLNFKRSIDVYIKEQAEKSVKKSTYIPRVSRIKTFQRFYQTQLKTQKIPNKFGDALVFILTMKGFSPESFARLYLTNELHICTFQKWRKNLSLPATRYLHVVSKIEEIINIPQGTLTDTLPLLLRNKISNKSPTAVKTKDKKDRTEPCVWTENLFNEWNELVAYKTSIFRPENTEEYNTGRWTRSTSSIPDEINYPAANVAESFLKSFFEFCTLNDENPDPKWRGLGIKEDSLTLALITDKNAVEKYIKIFCYARGGNKFNHGALTFLGMVSSFLRPGSGYIYQNHKLSKKLGINLTEKQWQARCIDTHNLLNRIRKDIKYLKKIGSCEFGWGRDPKEKISEILELKNPLSVTMQLVKDMLDDAEKLHTSSIKQAILYRDILLISMLQANPLREKMFRNMQLNKNLIQKKDGSWWLLFHRQDFKNRQFLTEDYEVQLSPQIWAIIEKYINEYRPILLGKRSCDEVFIAPEARAKLKNNQNDNRIARSGFWKIIVRRAKQYIPNSQGFGIHSFRHLVCTSIIKKNPDKGFGLAAKVLHDSPETVKRSYAHLKINEMFDPYNDIFAENWKNVGLQDYDQNDTTD